MIKIENLSAVINITEGCARSLEFYGTEYDVKAINRMMPDKFILQSSDFYPLLIERIGKRIFRVSIAVFVKSKPRVKCGKFWFELKPAPRDLTVFEFQIFTKEL